MKYLVTITPKPLATSAPIRLPAGAGGEHSAPTSTSSACAKAFIARIWLRDLAGASESAGA